MVSRVRLPTELVKGRPSGALGKVPTSTLPPPVARIHGEGCALDRTGRDRDRTVAFDGAVLDGQRDDHCERGPRGRRRLYLSAANGDERDLDRHRIDVVAVEPQCPQR